MLEGVRIHRSNEERPAHRAQADVNRALEVLGAEADAGEARISTSIQQVNRIKTIKRSMYSRAGFDLLRARVLNAACPRNNSTGNPDLGKPGHRKVAPEACRLWLGIGGTCDAEKDRSPRFEIG